jgi:hypothetical protein
VTQGGIVHVAMLPLASSRQDSRSDQRTIHQSPIPELFSVAHYKDAIPAKYETTDYISLNILHVDKGVCRNTTSMRKITPQAISPLPVLFFCFLWTRMFWCECPPSPVTFFSFLNILIISLVRFLVLSLSIHETHPSLIRRRLLHTLLQSVGRPTDCSNVCKTNCGQIFGIAFISSSFVEFLRTSIHRESTHGKSPDALCIWDPICVSCHLRYHIHLTL